MFSQYLHWQYVVGPTVLFEVLTNFHHALLRWFSVPTMLRTLVAHWHRDRVAYKQGTLTGLLQAWAWNAISRCIGFIVRTIILLLWLVTEVVFLVTAVTFMGLFILWPWLSLILLVLGFVMLL